MKIAIAFAFALLLWCMPALADDQAAVKDLIDRYDRAYLARDMATLEALLADEYRAFVEGKEADRATSLAKLVDPDNKWHPSSLSSTVDRIHASGDLAVAVGQVHWKENAKSGREHYTLVLRRDAGVWRVVEEHISDYPEDKKP